MAKRKRKTRTATGRFKKGHGKVGKKRRHKRRARGLLGLGVLGL